MVQRPLYAHDPESSLFAMAVGSSPVQIWRARPDTAAGEVPREEEAAGELRLDGVGQVVGLALEGQVLVTVLSGGEVAGWDLSELMEEGSEAAVRSLWRVDTGLRLVCAAHHRGNSHRLQLAMGAESGQVLLLGLRGESAPKLARGAVHRDKIEVLSFAQDGTCLASSARDRLIAIWSTQLGEEGELNLVRELRGSGGWPLALAFSDDHRRLASGCMDNGVYLWDLEAEEPLEAVRFDHAGWVDDVCWAGGDAVIISASWDNCVGVFGATPLKPRFLMGFHADYVVRLMAVPRTTLVVAASYDGRLTVWDWALGQLEGVLSGHADWVTEMVWLGRGRLASLSSDRTARIWSLKTMRCEVVLGRAPVERFELGGRFDLASFGVGTESSHAGLAGDEAELATATVRRFDGRGERWQDGVHRTALAMMDDAIDSARSVFAQDSEGARPGAGSEVLEHSTPSGGSDGVSAVERFDGEDEAASVADVEGGGSGYLSEKIGESVEGDGESQSDAPVESDSLDELDAELDAIEDALDALSEVGEVGKADSWLNTWSNEHPDSGTFDRPATSPLVSTMSADEPDISPGAAIRESGPLSEPEGVRELTDAGLMVASADSESMPEQAPEDDDGELAAPAEPPASAPVASVHGAAQAESGPSDAAFSSRFKPAADSPLVMDAARAGLSDLVRDAISKIVETEPSQPEESEESAEGDDGGGVAAARDAVEPVLTSPATLPPEPEPPKAVKRSLRARLKAVSLKLKQEEAERAEQQMKGESAAAADSESRLLDIMGEAFDLPSEAVRGPGAKAASPAAMPKPMGVDPNYNPVPVKPGDAIADLVPDELAFDEVFGAFGGEEGQAVQPGREDSPGEVVPEASASDAVEGGLPGGDEADEVSAGEEANARSKGRRQDVVSESVVPGQRVVAATSLQGDSAPSEVDEDSPEASGADSTHELRVAEVEALAAAAEMDEDGASVTSPGIAALQDDALTGRVEVHPEVAASVSGEEAVGTDQRDGNDERDARMPFREATGGESAGEHGPAMERADVLAVDERPGEVSGARTLTSFLGSAVRDEAVRDDEDVARWPTASSEARWDTVDPLKVEQEQEDRVDAWEGATQMLDADALPPVASSAPWAEERNFHRTARRGAPAREGAEPAVSGEEMTPIFEVEDDDPVAPRADSIVEESGAEESGAEVDEAYGNSTQMWGGLFHAPGGVRDPGPGQELTQVQDVSAFARREKTHGRGPGASEAEAPRRDRFSEPVRGMLRSEEALPEMTLGDASTSAQSVPEPLMGPADSEVSSRLQPGRAARTDELVVPEVAAASREKGAQRLSLSLEEFWDRATAAAPGMAILKRKVGALGDYAPARQLRVEERGPLLLASVESGRRMALCGGSRDLTLWQARGELEMMFEVKGPLVALSFLGDEASLCGVAESGELWMWMLPRAALGKASRVAEATIATGDTALRCAAIDVAARRVLTGNEEGRVRLWNVASGQCVGRLAPHGSPVTAVAFGTRGAISASADGQVRFWNAQGFLIDQLEGQGRVTALATFEGEVAWVEASGAVRVMRQGDSRARKLKGHHGEGRALAYREDGYLVTGGEDGRMLIYAPGGSEPVQEVQVPAPIHALSLSARRLVCACEGGAVYIFERERRRR
ncbi:hypothetical protein EA187_13155 [Lujinxingia sediminis]|uniref:WD40 repeat domain-containing protein n=1 Tax=Lujinxingia sediminis TaxID=2480984 RepID=A0ABY0CRG5_9DELT|nr:hypothetical protein [Lujinxingia sediminis]RVU43155.1 hypothetical protein EA187_13155 [Lujinxingia sediminis]